MKKHLLAALLIVPAFVAIVSPSAFAATASKLGDLQEFRTIASDTLVLVDKGDLTGAEKRITDFETTWDKQESVLYHKDKAEWGVIDDAADVAITSLRSGSPDTSSAHKAVDGLIHALDDPTAH